MFVKKKCSYMAIAIIEQVVFFLQLVCYRVKSAT